MLPKHCGMSPLTHVPYVYHQLSCVEYSSGTSLQSLHGQVWLHGFLQTERLVYERQEHCLEQNKQWAEPSGFGQVEKQM